MPHEKIYHGIYGNGLKVSWENDNLSGQVVVAVYSNAHNKQMSVSLDKEEVGNLVRYLKRASTKTWARHLDGAEVRTYWPDGWGSIYNTDEPFPRMIEMGAGVLPTETFAAALNPDSADGHEYLVVLSTGHVHKGKKIGRHAWYKPGDNIPNRSEIAYIDCSTDNPTLEKDDPEEWGQTLEKYLSTMVCDEPGSYGSVYYYTFEDPNPPLDEWRFMPSA